MDQLFNGKQLISNLNKADIKLLLELACKVTLFLFDGVFYHQVDGAAMGSPLGPHLANIFMNFHEQKWLQDCPPDIKPKYYRRYVDDIFVLCDSNEKLE